MIRRDGSGGDGGLEAYQATPTGAVSNAIQAKHFERRLRVAQWRQIDKSARKVMSDNRADGALAQYIVCTNCDFTKAERRTWDEYVGRWESESKSLGYHRAIVFEHWGAARLREKLLKPEHFGLAVYFFDVPDLTPERMWQVSRTTIENLGDRYLPDLHARTSCESELSWFLRSTSALTAFHERIRTQVAPELLRPWRKKVDWSPGAAPVAARSHAYLQSVLDSLGDGYSWPLSVTDLSNRLQEFNGSLHELTKLRADELSKDAAYKGDRANTAARSETGFVEGIHLGLPVEHVEHIDASGMLVVGGAGKGKTHVLAHVVSKYMSAKGAVVFLEGGSFTSSEPPWKQFLSLIDFDGDVQGFLSAFSTMSLSTPLPGLICIDALNETPDRNVWLRHLLTFATQIRQYRNLKLLVSCREDYLDVTLPPQLQQLTVVGWGRVNHRGLDVDISSAIGHYLSTYEVSGTPAQCFQEEFRTPLFLKLVCEAFHRRAIPVGTLSLTAVLQEYLKQKSSSIQNRLDVRASIVQSAIHALAGLFAERGLASLPEHEVREVLLRFHNVTTESQSLYRALLSESVLHETRSVKPGTGQHETAARFAYERLWDYCVSLYFWPVDASLPEMILGHLRDVKWLRQFAGVVQIFAMRFPEAGYGEIHDVAEVEPTRKSSLFNSALIDSLSWRHTNSITDRTWELVNVVIRQDRYQVFELYLQWALLCDHPRNAEVLHQRLLSMAGGLASRDRWWTLELNKRFTFETDWIGEQFLVLAEEGVGLDDRQAYLLALTITWMLTTTHVESRQRVSIALARLLRNRIGMAVRLLTAFKQVDDPYVLNGLMFACAAAAYVATAGDDALTSLVRLAHHVVFGTECDRPNLHSRFYAGHLCETALRLRCLPDDVTPESFHPPFKSTWPEIQSEAAFKEWESRVSSEYEAFSTWNSVLRSTRPYEGDWGHYEMTPAVTEFEDERLESRRPGRRSKEESFDPFEAQRFVVQRVVEMGLDAKMRDETSTYVNVSRDRPVVERLGKKYQWIALSELLASLSDHCLPSKHSVSQEIVPESLRVEDLYDPAVLLAPAKVHRETVILAEEECPEWYRIPHQIASRLSDSRRLDLCTNKTFDFPRELLTLELDGVRWIPLASNIEFVEPRPSYMDGFHAGPRARIYWSARSYLVPTAQRGQLQRALSAEEVGNSYSPIAPTINSTLDLLPKYPIGARYDEYALVDDLRSIGAWFTTCPYSSGDEDGTLNGVIPSPQFARLSGIHWSRSGLSFSDLNSGMILFESFHHNDFSAVAFQRDALLELLKRTRHSLFWRVYCGKLIEHGEDSQIGRQKQATSRECVAVFRMESNGVPECVWASTWLKWPLAAREELDLKF